ncbi:MAG: class I SAM-dependent methyltransferase [Deltaproteobacteria bacterium]|nr:class I SAM-dependent methyltransferase [Deltaproteobacteria bacterium]
MSLRGPPEVFAREVLPRLLAAPAELILDALPPLQPQTRFLEVGAGGAVVARALVERIAGLGRLVAIDEDADLALALPAGPKRGARAVAGFPQLPFQNAVFDVAIANLVLGDAHKDGPRLAELRRVLRPGGWLLATVALRGSFDELFDLLGEACEATGLLQLRATTLEAKAALPDDDVLRARLTEAGYTVAQLGIEERLLCLIDGDALLDDALVREVLLPALLGVPLPEEARDALVRAANTWFKGGMPLRVRTAIITARVDKKT